MHVLIVDDDLGQAQLLGQLLAHDGITSTAVASEAEALAALAVQRSDVAILDLGMPGLDGNELLGRLRERSSGLPAILVTGWPERDPRVAAFLERGGTAYLAKPVVPSKLLALLARLAAAAGADE